MQLPGDVHLSYCSNIHPGQTLEQVYESLRNYTVPVKEKLAPEHPFGVGLRLSGEAARELMKQGALRAFRSWLQDEGMYVYTINGFPYGNFHGQRVKEQVHQPDWREKERLRYTQNLIHILAGLLPKEQQEGSISTNPLSYKYWVDQQNPGMWEGIVGHLMEAVETMHREHRQSGKLIHLDLEPEPDGLLEHTGEVVDFFRNHLMSTGVAILQQRLSADKATAGELIRTHIRLCLDTCHAAVEYEDAARMLKRLDTEGIRVGKVHLSSALKIDFPEDETAFRQQLERKKQDLEAFAESTYLHQVIQRNRDGSILQYPDLPDALKELEQQTGRAAEWRIHFHVPVFMDFYESFESTQKQIREVLNVISGCNHYEVETYTWAVLPPGLRTNVVDMITRELEWAREVFSKRIPQNV